jgi:uncharacterized phage protein (TIGR02218 family)
VKTISSGLEANIALPSTTLATLWKITRKDGEIFGFTDHDSDILYAGLLYEAMTGFVASDVSTQGKLNVDNLETESHFDAASITESDVVAGKWDRARVDVYRVDWGDVTLGVYQQRRGETGVFSFDGRRFKAELRGLMQYLANQIGRVYTAPCDATLGDARCGVDLDGSPALRKSFTVGTATSRQQFTDAALTEANDWYQFGVVEWLTGENAGSSMEVRSSTSAGVIVLQIPMTRDIAVGDTGTITPGCDKQGDTCRDKFSNKVNFRGFEDIPGIDRMLVSDPR